jgi:hypothetical protein
MIAHQYFARQRMNDQGGCDDVVSLTAEAFGVVDVERYRDHSRGIS